MTIDKEDLNEFKADGEDSSTSDPVAPAGGDPKKKNRKADLSKTVDPKADDIEDDEKTPQNKGFMKQAPARKADKRTVKQSVSEMFAGQDLSEEFKERASVVFEAALNGVIAEEVERLEEEFDDRLAEQAEIAVGELVEKIDSYLSYVVEHWMEENQVAIDRGIRTEIAESFMSDLRELMEEHYIAASDEDLDVVADMADKLSEAEEKRDIAIQELIEIKRQLVEAEKREILDELSEGLTQTQAERLEKLAEGLDADGPDHYREKVGILRENYFSKTAKTLTEDSHFNDPMDLDESDSSMNISPEMANLVAAISKTIRK